MPLDESDCAATYKVLILGEHSVGKTALLNRLMGREFRVSMMPTIGQYWNLRVRCACVGVCVCVRFHRA